MDERKYQRMINCEVEEPLKGEVIVNLMKAHERCWYSHVCDRKVDIKEDHQLADNEMKGGRPKTRWEYQVMRDVK